MYNSPDRVRLGVIFELAFPHWLTNSSIKRHGILFWHHSEKTGVEAQTGGAYLILSVSYVFPKDKAQDFGSPRVQGGEGISGAMV